MHVNLRRANWLFAAALLFALCGTGQSAVYFQDDFDGYADDAAVVAAGWQIVDGSPTAEADWTITNPGGRLNPFGSTGNFMVTDTDAGSPDGSDTNEELISPAVDLSAASRIWLHFTTAMIPNDNGESRFHVDVSSDGGATWQRVFESYAPGVATTGLDGNAGGRMIPVEIDVSAELAGAAAAHVRFHNLDGSDDWFWAVDDVVLDDQPGMTGGSLVLFGPEGFLLGIPADWTVETLNNTNPWTTTDPCGRAVGAGAPTSSTVNRLEAPFAILDSDCNPDAEEDDSLITPEIDCTGVGTVYLHVNSEMKYNDGQPTVGDIDVSTDGGTTWTTIWSYDESVIPVIDNEVVFDPIVAEVPQAAGEAAVRFRFRYRGNGDEWWWAVDDVKVTADGYYEEDFDGYDSDADVIAAGWQIVDNSGTAETDWTITNIGGRGNPMASFGNFMSVDSDAGSPDGDDTDEQLISPSIDLSGATEAYLHFATFIEPYENGESVHNVDVSTDGGSSWTTVYTRAAPDSLYATATTTTEQGNANGTIIPVSVDLSGIAAGEPDVKIRFNYLYANNDYFWIVDSIRIDGFPGYRTGRVISFPEGTTDFTYAAAPGNEVPVGVAGTDPIFSEDFGSPGTDPAPPPAGWQVISDTGNPDDRWNITGIGHPCMRNAAGIPAYDVVNRLGNENDNDFFAFIDSDCIDNGRPSEDQQLITPALDCSGFKEVFLDIKSEMKYNVGATIGDIDVSRDGGTTWTTLFRYGQDNGSSPPDPRDNQNYYDPMVVDASLAAGSTDVQFRFRFRGNEWEWFWAVDDIVVRGNPGVAVTPEPPDQPTLTAPATVTPLEDVPLQGSAFSDPNVGDTHGRSVWTIARNPDMSGFLFEVTSDVFLTEFVIPFERLFPGSTYYATVQYEDQVGLPSLPSDAVSVTVGAFPSPIFFEDFESTPDYTIPADWTETNNTDPCNPGFDPNDANSDTYLGFTVVPFDTLQNVFGGNRVNVPEVVDGKSIYAESDKRCGKQCQELLTPVVPLNGAMEVWVAFMSNYMQNQDSIACLEYTVDGGATWLPALYMIDQDDIIRTGGGAVDGDATMTAVFGDVADCNGDGNGTYGEATLARPFSAQSDFISGRVNDDTVESKRFERIRLEGADGAASIQFRFFQSGTASWFWGIDEFGVYSMAAGPAPFALISISENPSGDLVLEWNGGNPPYQVEATTPDALPGGWGARGPATSDTTATVTPTDPAEVYRVRGN